MDEFCEDYNLYWETNMFLQSEELESWGFEDPALSGSFDSSSPDGAGSTSPASNSKNIVSERNRRKKLNERLFALRAAVPTISKMDKSSIVKDAINYIHVLQAEERKIQSEITELEHRRLSRVLRTTPSSMDFHQEEQGKLFPPSRPKKKMTMMSRGSNCGSRPRIDVELRFSFIGDKTMAINLTCSKVAGALVKLCEVIESLKYKIVTTHISAFGGKIFKTIVVESLGRPVMSKGKSLDSIRWKLKHFNLARNILTSLANTGIRVNEDEMELLKFSLETTIADLNNPQTPMSVCVQNCSC